MYYNNIVGVNFAIVTGWSIVELTDWICSIHNGMRSYVNVLIFVFVKLGIPRALVSPCCR